MAQNQGRVARLDTGPAGTHSGRRQAAAVHVWFSTAAKVTRVSGRGVGMDTVRRDIESAGEKIAVHTTSGRGTNFSITLPRSVSTQILEAFLVVVGDSYFELPIDRVADAFALESATATRMPSGHRSIKRHGDVLPTSI